VTASTALVGPLPRHHFGWHPVVVGADLPTDTTDIRFALCTEHRFACDCREAVLAEDRNEYRLMLDAWTRAAQRQLAGHRLRDFGPDDFDPTDDPDLYRRYGRGDGPDACQCGGCRLVRAADPVGTGLIDYRTGRILAPQQEGGPR
jgi:hypothetical protein